MKTIDKYEIETLTNSPTIELPTSMHGSTQLLAVRNQNNKLMAWILHDIVEEGQPSRKATFQFKLVATGEEVKLTSSNVIQYEFIDTVFLRDSVIHVFCKRDW